MFHNLSSYLPSHFTVIQQIDTSISQSFRNLQFTALFENKGFDAVGPYMDLFVLHEKE